MENRAYNYLFVIFLFCIIFSVNLFSLRYDSITYDESSHYSYGVRMGLLKPERAGPDIFYDSQMPFSFLSVLSLRIIKNIKMDSLMTRFMAYGKLQHDDKTIGIMIGRTATIIFSLILAFYVFKWSKELYGVAAAVFSLLIYTFCPNIIAHSHLVTNDLYVAAMITISIYYFWRFIKLGGWRRALVSAFMLGLAQLAKYTSLFLYPLFILILVIRYWGRTLVFIRTKDLKGFSGLLAEFFKYTILFIAISILVINMGFLFNKPFTFITDYKTESSPIKMIQSKFTILKYIPIPLPRPYIEGMIKVIENNETGRSFGNAYMLGRLKEAGNGAKHFIGYYFVAFLFKVPIATQLVILISILYYIFNYKKYNFLEDELFLIVPVLIFAIYFNFFNERALGIRYFLVVLPLLYIFCGSFFKNWKFFNIKLKGAVIALSAYLIISVLSYFPHFIPYFNELVWDRKQAYKILADSNIDWGQSDWALDEYLEKNPDVRVNPSSPIAGKIVVSVNNLVGVSDAKRYRWLRENFEPVDHITYSYLVYTVTPEELKRIKTY